MNAFEKEWKKLRGRKCEELFFRIEALALYLFGDGGQWGMCDDGERVIALQNLISAMFLETFILLRKDGLLTPDSPLKNIGFVAAVIANWESSSKTRKIVNLCKEASIRVALGPEEFEYDDGVDIEKLAAGEGVGDNDEDDDDEDDEDEDEDEEEDRKDEKKSEDEDGGFGKAVCPLRREYRVVN